VTKPDCDAKPGYIIKNPSDIGSRVVLLEADAANELKPQALDFADEKWKHSSLESELRERLETSHPTFEVL
jgi:hypothetical protein